MGSVRENKAGRLAVQSPINGLKSGDSLSVNGVCLTVTKKSIRGRRPALFQFDLSPETLSRTNLGALKTGEKVNLEKPLRAGDLLGGHWVSGHVDCRSEILSRKALSDGSLILRVSLPGSLRPYMAVKGSVTLDGVSLTVTKVGKDFLETVLIPHTLKVTTLGLKKEKDSVNLEVDMLARYVFQSAGIARRRF